MNTFSPKQIFMCDDTSTITVYMITSIRDDYDRIDYTAVATDDEGRAYHWEGSQTAAELFQTLLDARQLA